MLKNANGELSQPLSSNPGSLLGVKTCVQLQPGGVPAIVVEVKSFEIHSEQFTTWRGALAHHQDRLLRSDSSARGRTRPSV